LVSTGSLECLHSGRGGGGGRANNENVNFLGLSR
jgi:hypothetical protein